MGHNICLQFILDNINQKVMDRFYWNFCEMLIMVYGTDDSDHRLEPGIFKMIFVLSLHSAILEVFSLHRGYGPSINQ